MSSLLRPSRDEQVATWSTSDPTSSGVKSGPGFISYMLRFLALSAILFSVFFLLRRYRRGGIRLTDHLPRWKVDRSNLERSISSMEDGDLLIALEDPSHPSGSVQDPAADQASIGRLAHPTYTKNTTLRENVLHIPHQPSVAFTEQPQVCRPLNAWLPEQKSQELLPADPVLNQIHHTQELKLAPHPEEPCWQRASKLTTASSAMIHSHPPTKPTNLPLPTPTIRRHSYPLDDPAVDSDSVTPTVSAPTRRSRTFPVENGSLRKDSLVQTRGWRRHVMVVGGPPG